MVLNDASHPHVTGGFLSEWQKLRGLKTLGATVDHPLLGKRFALRLTSALGFGRHLSDGY